MKNVPMSLSQLIQIGYPNMIVSIVKMLQGHNDDTYNNITYIENIWALNMGNITYNDITYKDITYKDITYNWLYLQITLLINYFTYDSN